MPKFYVSYTVLYLLLGLIIYLIVLSHRNLPKVEVTFEETDRVRETKMNILQGYYETLKMKPDEKVAKMFVR